jgi:hypothetical protein
MAEWDLTADGNHYDLIAMLSEQHIAAGGDVLTPCLVLPLRWQERLPPSGARQDTQRALAVSFDLQISQPNSPYPYWTRTGLLPISTQIEPTLPLPRAVIEVLSLSRVSPDADVVLNIRVWALATLQRTPGSVGIHWHHNFMPVSISAAKWHAMLGQWGFPAFRLVPISMELPGGLEADNKAARDLWAATRQHLITAQREWAANNVANAGRELRFAVQSAVLAWGAIWHPQDPPSANAKWWDVMQSLAKDIPGSNIQTGTINEEAPAHHKRAFTFLLLLRNLNTVANPPHHPGTAAAYTNADVDMLVTSTTAALRALPEFWRQFPVPLGEDALEKKAGN